MDDESIERHRFRIEIAVMLLAAAAVAVSAWQGYLTRQQFIATENHLLDDRRYETTPFLAANTRELRKDMATGKWSGACEIINLGRGIALDVRVIWNLGDRNTHANVGDRRHLLPGESLKIADLANLFDAVAADGKPQVWTGVSITLQATTVDWRNEITRQDVDIDYNAQERFISLRFEGIRILQPASD